MPGAEWIDKRRDLRWERGAEGRLELRSPGLDAIREWRERRLYEDDTEWQAFLAAHPELDEDGDDAR